MCGERWSGGCFKEKNKYFSKENISTEYVLQENFEGGHNHGLGEQEYTRYQKKRNQNIQLKIKDFLDLSRNFR